jgi:acyl-CoA synthetase (NDP forming)
MHKGLAPGVIKAIAKILIQADQEGRQVLFEHEVYAVLKLLGLNIPNYLVVTEKEAITRKTMALFGSKQLVLKVISRDITHKQKFNGVKIIYKDLDFARFTFDKMVSRLKKEGFHVEGILIVECIEYSKALGNEVLLGFRESEAFGPVISFSKGGSDAEHFATYFSPPNLILAPIDKKWSTALLASTKIQKKYIETGAVDYISKIVNAEVKLSHLATAFSNYSEGKTRFCIREFEINPFIFDSDGVFIALDGYARFALRNPQKAMLKLRPDDSITSFFEPNGIAVVGVSRSDTGKSGNIILKNLIGLNRKDVYGVNRRGGNVPIAGKKITLYPSVTAIKNRIDLAIITVPAEHALAVVQSCAQKHVKAVILIPGGFGEIKKNLDIEAQILDIADKSHMRIMGPNCLGIVYAGNFATPGVNTFFIPEEKFRVNLEKNKNVAVLSQSGALGITEIYNLRNSISPKVIVSYGNQLDVDIGDLVAYFDHDAMVDVIGCYIEGFKPGAGRKFFNIAARCRKPLIIYKAGRTTAGRQATESHTASIAGEYAVAKAAMKQAGAIVADSMIDHGDFIKTFALLSTFRVTGNKVAIIANAGYEKTYAADNLGDLELSEFDDKTLWDLRHILPDFVTAEPLLDLTPMASDEMFEQCMETVLKSDAVDALFVSIVPHGAVIHTTDDEIARNTDNIAARIVRIVHKYKKPTAVSVNVTSGADAVYHKFGQILDTGGVPTFLTAKRAMVCLNAFIRYHRTQKERAFSEWLK